MYSVSSISFMEQALDSIHILTHPADTLRFYYKINLLHEAHFPIDVSLDAQDCTLYSMIYCKVNSLFFI